MQTRFIATLTLVTLISTVILVGLQRSSTQTPAYAPTTLTSSTQQLLVNPTEQQVIDLVNGTKAYNFNLGLESIAQNHFAFRSGGSSGANETAYWIKNQFQSFGIQAWLEPFEFTTWDLQEQPSLVIDDDGNPVTTNDQTTLSSFQCEHLSWPTSMNGAFADLAILPLPPAADRSQIGATSINATAWNAVNTSGKILLIGREVRWASNWQSTFRNKLASQTPAAVVFTWWYSWMNFTPPMFSSSGGRPMSGYGPYFWNLHVPVGFVDHEDGTWIRNREATTDVSANVTIKSAIGTGTHYNVVGRIGGFTNPEKTVIISGHYDTIMGNGFCDNGAGTAGVLELARVMSEAVRNGSYKPTYTLLFVGFADEELYLVGSINYVKMHKADMPNILALINLDCIGSDDLVVSQTDPANGLDLDQTVVQAAQDLGVPITTEPPGGSDHEVFLDPVAAEGMYSQYWGLSADIADALPVPSSTMLVSYPLLYSDKWDMGVAGWIHTAYDNSTSTTTLDWVDIADLENHLKVAALATIRVSPDAPICPRNIAMVGVMPLKTIVGQTYTMQVNITVENQGGYWEYITLTLYANNAFAMRAEYVALKNATSATIVFKWNTTGFAKGNCTLEASAGIVLNETSIADNNRTSPASIIVNTAGDLTSYSGPPDGKVDMRDISAVCLRFGNTPSSPNWDANYDINDDGTVNMRDISIACANFGKRD